MAAPRPAAQRTGAARAAASTDTASTRGAGRAAATTRAAATGTTRTRTTGTAGRSTVREKTRTGRTVPQPRGTGRVPVDRASTRARVAGNTALAPRTAPIQRKAPPLAVVPAVEGPSPRTPFVFLVFTLVGAGLIALLLLNTAVNENAFRLHNIETDQAALDRREQQLKGDLAALVSPGNLNAAALRLGLVPMPAGPPAYIYLPSGEIVGEPTPAKPSPPGPAADVTPVPGLIAKPEAATPENAAAPQLDQGAVR